MELKKIDITDIPGFRIGNAGSEEGGTGCTAVICDGGAVSGVDVRGGGPATRETELLKPVNLAQTIHCVMLSGGSAFGLSVSDGAMRYLDEKGIGFDTSYGVVPLVCGASLFDLPIGDPKVRPDSAMGFEACVNSEDRSLFRRGNYGAGTGATVGKYAGAERMMKSGLGAYAVAAGELMCGAVVAVNSLGDVFDYDTGEKLAGMLAADGNGFGDTVAAMYEDLCVKRNVFTGNTTIGCVITNAKLTKDQANKLAQMAHDGYARTISPVHTSADGDTIFLMSRGEVEVNADALGTLAAEVMGRAINDAVLSARDAYGIRSAFGLKR